jgi:hypothetical protein
MTFWKWIRKESKQFIADLTAPLDRMDKGLLFFLSGIAIAIGGFGIGFPLGTLHFGNYGLLTFLVLPIGGLFALYGYYLFSSKDEIEGEKQ